MTDVLLFAGYWLGGFVLAIFGSMSIGFTLGALVGLLNMFRFKWTWLLVTGYVAGAIVCALLSQGVLYLAGMVGDYTERNMQTALMVGVVFPWLFAVPIIPQYISTAWRQTSGKA